MVKADARWLTTEPRPIVMGSNPSPTKKLDGINEKKQILIRKEVTELGITTSKNIFLVQSIKKYKENYQQIL